MCIKLFLYVHMICHITVRLNIHDDLNVYLYFHMVSWRQEQNPMNCTGNGKCTQEIECHTDYLYVCFGFPTRPTWGDTANHLNSPAVENTFSYIASVLALPLRWAKTRILFCFILFAFCLNWAYLSFLKREHATT